MLSCSYLNSNFKCNSTISYGIVGYASGIMFGVFVYNMVSSKWEKKIAPLGYNVALFNIYAITGLCSGLYIGYNKDKQ